MKAATRRSQARRKAGKEPGPRRAVVHVREFLADSLTPLAVYRRLAELSPIRFLLESVTGGEQVSRFSFLGAKPSELYRLYDDRLEVERGGKRRTLDGEPLAALRRVLGSINIWQIMRTHQIRSKLLNLNC